MNAAAHHNPEVEAQRPGYCVVSTTADLFLSDDPDDTHGLVMWRGGRYTWCKPGGPVRIWMWHSEASAAAKLAGGEVVTVPRFNGHHREWQAVRP